MKRIKTYIYTTPPGASLADVLASLSRADVFVKCEELGTTSDAVFWCIEEYKTH